MNWHPGRHLLAPTPLRVPEFPRLRFLLSLPYPGVITYFPVPDAGSTIRVGVAAFAISFAVLSFGPVLINLLKGEVPAQVPEPISFDLAA
jgi:hypothetical protein